MKSNNPYESPEETAIKNPGRVPSYFVIVFRYFVVILWVLIPFGSFIANLFLKPLYDGYGSDLPLISKAFFDWRTPCFLSIPTLAIILAMVRMRPGLLRFCLALIAILPGLIVILVCGLADWMPWASIQAGLRR